VVFASHDLDRAEPLAHRIVTMAGGRIEPDGPGAPVPAPRPVVPLAASC
jgi:ABC-type sulfate/molybdate transport systems ATPase subunit